MYQVHRCYTHKGSEPNIFQSSDLQYVVRNNFKRTRKQNLTKLLLAANLKAVLAWYKDNQTWFLLVGISPF